MREDSRANMRTHMSVKEMGELLGLGKTESYWLIHKNYFPSTTRYGKTWVELAGFEDWYANQTKYRKKDGEEPGRMLREHSYSVQELAQLLSISESAAYELVKKNLFRTETHGRWMRVPKDSFWNWYEGQDHYRTREDRERDSKDAVPGTTLSEAAMCGSSRNAIHEVHESRYITLAEAARMAGISRQAVSGYMNQGCFLMIKKGRNVRLGRPEFCQWLEARRHQPASRTAT